MYNHNKKRILLAALSIVLIVGLIASFGVQAKRNRITFVLPDTSSAENVSIRHTQFAQAAAISGKRLTTEGFEKTLENDNFELWLRKESAAVRLVDKKSGYIWGALPTDSTEDLNDYWNSMANSLVTIEYYDSSNASYQMSLSDERFVCTYEADDEEDTLVCIAECEEIGIDFNVVLSLKEDHIEVGLEEDSLLEYDLENYYLAKMHFLPFLGSTKQGEMDGYIFIPDGSGGLMRFDANMKYSTSYSAKLYGLDAGIDPVNQVNDLVAKRTDDYLVDEIRASVPVYGIVHGAEQYALMTVIDSGRDYATISASLASETIPYNWAETVFEFRQLYDQPVSKTNTVKSPQKDINHFTPELSFYLLSGDKASYSGMATTYRKLLEEDGTLAAEAKKYNEIPMRVEVVASDVRQGLIFNGVTTFTTVDEAKQIQSDLSKIGINNLTMVINGWQKGGSNAYKFNSFATQGSVGSLGDLAELRDAVTEKGGNFYLQERVTTMTSAQGRLNYLANMSMAQKLSFYLRDNPEVMFPETYLVAPDKVLSVLQNATDKLTGFNLNLPRFGSELYSDYRQEGNTTRSRTRSNFVKAAEKVREGGQKLAMSAPNVYMWENCDEYFDIPMMNSQYTFESDSVPFLQMLLKGHIDYYAPYANQGFYSTASTLKTLEYGAYPSFLVMAADNEDLNKTPMVDYFSLNYKDWEDTMKSVYSKTADALKNVEGNVTMDDHRAVARGVVRVTYSNGVKIYVNYNAADVAVDGVTVPGLGYAVERG